MLAMCIVITQPDYGNAEQRISALFAANIRERIALGDSPENFAAEILQTVPRVCRLMRAEKKSFYNNDMCLAEGEELGSNGLQSWCDRSSTWEYDRNPTRGLKRQ